MGSLGCPGTTSVDQVGLELKRSTRRYLPSTFIFFVLCIYVTVYKYICIYMWYFNSLIIFKAYT